MVKRGGWHTAVFKTKQNEYNTVKFKNKINYKKKRRKDKKKKDL